MALIFQDQLQVTDGSGLYTLMGFANGTWQDIHTITGATSGRIEVDNDLNTIDVDTDIFIVGQTYPFKWVDGNGVESNIVYITIPGVLTLLSIAPAEGGGCLVTYDAILGGGAICLVDQEKEEGECAGFPQITGPTNLINQQADVYEQQYVSGHRYYLQDNNLTSNILIAP